MNNPPDHRWDLYARLSVCFAAVLILVLAIDQAERRVTLRLDQRGAPALVSTPFIPLGVGRFAFLRRLYASQSEHRVFAVAAGVAFYAILAIFPAIAAIVSLYGLYADASTIQAHIESLTNILPEGGLEVMRDELKRVTSQPNGTLGLTFLISLVISLWSANSGMKALFDALNVVFGAREQRSFIKLNAISLCFTLGAIAFVLFASGVVVVIPIMFHYVGFESAEAVILDLVRWPVMLGLGALGFALVYRFGPSHHEHKGGWITWGSVCAACVWLAMSLLFSWYTANFGSYDKTYGSLGAVIGFMTWLWLSTVVILIGAEIDALRHQQKREQTITRGCLQV